MQYKSSFFLKNLWGSSDVSWNTRVSLPTSQAKNTSVFFIPTVHLEISYDYDTHTDMCLISPTTGLGVTLKPLWKALVQSFSY